MIYPGLVSVTFRHLSVKEVIELALKAKLTCIEWGGDVHVPHGDLEIAKSVQLQTTEAGFKVNAYGSYYRVGSFDKSQIEFQDVINTARVLGALTIRVWAGEISSESASESHWDEVVADSNRIADMAALADISISFEYHSHTLTDTNNSAFKLLGLLPHPNINTFWQPHNYTTLNYNLEGLATILPKVSDFHVFFWENSQNRFPLAAGEDFWIPVLQMANKTSRDHFFSLEFVEKNSEGNFLKDALVLKDWIELVEKKHSEVIEKNKNKIILTGMKWCGKTSVGQLLANNLDIEFIELDREIEKRHYLKTDEKLTSEEIYSLQGPNNFRCLQSETLEDISNQFEDKEFVLATGCLTAMTLENHQRLKKMGLLIHIDTRQDILLERILNGGISVIFSGTKYFESSLTDLLEESLPIYRQLADIINQCAFESPEDIAFNIAKQITR